MWQVGQQTFLRRRSRGISEVETQCLIFTCEASFHARILHTSSRCHGPPLINTPLQRGGTAPVGGVNRFSGFFTVSETAEAGGCPWSAHPHPPAAGGVMRA